MTSWLLALALAFPASQNDTIELVETAPVETTLGSDAIPEAHEVWLDMINGAKTSLDFAHFYASDVAPSRLTPVLRAVEAAAKRGVRVRFLAEKKFHRTYPEILDHFASLSGIEVLHYDISGHTGGILHAKYFIADSSDVFLGSQNFDWRALEHIQELGVRVRSKELASALDQVFEMDWKLAGGKVAEAQYDIKFPIELKHDEASVQATLVCSPKDLLPNAELWDLPKLIGMIDGAKRSVRIQLLNYKAAFYDKRYFGELESALRRAANRKVRVELLLADWSKSRGTIEGLKSLHVLPNINIRLTTLPEHSGGFIDFARVCHSKYMVVDGKAAWIGTSNWSGDYFYQSRNVGLIIEGASFGKVLDDYFVRGWTSEYAYDVDPCKEYTPPRRQ